MPESIGNQSSQKIQNTQKTKGSSAIPRRAAIAGLGTLVLGATGLKAMHTSEQINNSAKSRKIQSSFKEVLSSSPENALAYIIHLVDREPSQGELCEYFSCLKSIRDTVEKYTIEGGATAIKNIFDKVGSDDYQSPELRAMATSTIIDLIDHESLNIN